MSSPLRTGLPDDGRVCSSMTLFSIGTSTSSRTSLTPQIFIFSLCIILSGFRVDFFCVHNGYGACRTLILNHDNGGASSLLNPLGFVFKSHKVGFFCIINPIGQFMARPSYCYSVHPLFHIPALV